MKRSASAGSGAGGKTNLLSVARVFIRQGRIAAIEPCGAGHIHETYRVRTAAKANPGYVLQRINTRVFADVPKLMENVVRVTAHVKSKTARNRPALIVVPAENGRPFLRDDAGNFWRCYRFIEHREPGDRFAGRGIAREAGKFFGRFLVQMSDLPGPPLHETIRGFHDIEFHLGRFGDLLHIDSARRKKEVATEIDFVRSRAPEMKKILELGRAGRIPLRVTHNDTKFNNILFDASGRGVCIVDLDTVMPGYVHYDFGDAVRSAANTAAEDERRLARVGFDLDVFREFARGYLGETRSLLNADEIASLAFAARFMAYLLGLRFLNDHLDGDRYFRIARPDHNLRRARVQFKLLEAMEHLGAEMEEAISAIIRS